MRELSQNITSLKKKSTLMGPKELVLPEHGDRIQSPKRCVYIKPGRRIMSRNIIFVLMYHRQKLSDLNYQSP
jgi:hypothetical protein